MAAPGALASTAVSAEHWNSLHDLLRRDAELSASLTTAALRGPCLGHPFLQSSLREFRASVVEFFSLDSSSLELVALCLDSLSAEPFHRVRQGPATSFYFRGSVPLGILRTWNATDMGRAAGKMEKVEEQLRSLELASSGAAVASHDCVNMAKDVEVHRLSIPEAPPAFDPCPFLDEAMRTLYFQPSAVA